MSNHDRDNAACPLNEPGIATRPDRLNTLCMCPQTGPNRLADLQADIAKRVPFPAKWLEQRRGKGAEWRIYNGEIMPFLDGAASYCPVCQERSCECDWEEYNAGVVDQYG